jgi:hypothetical protein
MIVENLLSACWLRKASFEVSRLVRAQCVYIWSDWKGSRFTVATAAGATGTSEWLTLFNAGTRRQTLDQNAIALAVTTSK